MSERAKLSRRLLEGAAVGAGCFVLSILLGLLLGPLKWQVMDFWVRAAPRPDVHGGPVVIAVIDESSLNYYRSMGFGYSWPWRRDFMAQAVDYLTKCGAKAVVFDVEFPDRHPSDDPAAPFEDQTDPVLLEAIQRSGRVVAAVRLLRNGQGKEAGRSNALVDRYGEAIVRAAPPAPPEVYRGAALPFAATHADGKPWAIDDAAAAMGNVSGRPDADGIFRRIAPLVFLGTDGPSRPTCQDEKLIPALSLATVLMWYNPKYVALGWSNVRTDAFNIPVDGDGKMVLKWYGPSDVGPDGRGRTFDYVSMGEVVRRAAAALQAEMRAKQAGKTYTYRDGVFKDRVVLIGANVAGLYDMKASPFSDVVPGVEIHATAITNMLKGDYARAGRGGWAWGLAAALALATGMLVVALYRAHYTIPALLLMAGVPALAGYEMYAQRARLINVIPGWSAVLVTFIGATSYNLVTEGRRRKAIKSMFQTYVAPAVVDQMIEHPELYKLGGERKPMTVFFSDIRGFTSISEGLGAEAVVEMLNIYLTAVSEIIIRHRGTLDKYIGDAVVAVYGAPLEMADHAMVACEATLEIVRALGERINPAIVKRGWPAIRIGCGVNSDLICAGNMGSEQRKDYTVIGDGVNLASRLEGLNKYYGTTILIGEETHRQLDGRLHCRLVDKVAVKGRTEGVLVHELLGREQADETAALAEHYEAALRASWERRWDEALARLEKALEVRPEDAPSLRLKKRVEAFKETPPPDDWHGVTVMDAK